MVAPGQEVEIIPPGRSVLRLSAQEAPAGAVDAAMLPLTALSIAMGVAMMPVFATMFVLMVPVRWMFGEPGRR